MNKTLVIMAAGMGSRFGGLKQLEPVGSKGEIIADYSVFDAIRAGFTKVVFIIRKEYDEYFKNNIINKYFDKIDVAIVYQELDCLPKGYKVNENRTKMLGTAHALYCAKEEVDNDFVVINADDFYGLDSFIIANNVLSNSSNDTYVSINYPFYITKSNYGKVKRGIVEESNGYIKDIKECEIDENLKAKKLLSNEVFKIKDDTLVSVNFFGLKTGFFKYLERELKLFLESDIGDDKEFFLPDVLKKGIKSGWFKVLSKKSTSKWRGITYKEDLESLKKEINELIEEGSYPKYLWKK